MARTADRGPRPGAGAGDRRLAAHIHARGVCVPAGADEAAGPDQPANALVPGPHAGRALAAVALDIAPAGASEHARAHPVPAGAVGARAALVADLQLQPGPDGLVGGRLGQRGRHERRPIAAHPHCGDLVRTVLRAGLDGRLPLQPPAPQGWTAAGAAARALAAVWQLHHLRGLLAGLLPVADRGEQLAEDQAAPGALTPRTRPRADGPARR